jgi:hypothetical protein
MPELNPMGYPDWAFSMTIKLVSTPPAKPANLP